VTDAAESAQEPLHPEEVTVEDWQRSAEAFADLADPAVMDAAWRPRADRSTGQRMSG
jgi:hypothetical protein